MMRFITFALMLIWLPSVALAEAPNVLFIAVDDLRPELNCYGRTHIRSPNIDRLASSGVLFEQAYCMVPTCGASRASLMTGIRPAPKRFVSYLTRADKDAPNAATMNTHFKRNGYTTISLGKVFHHTADNAKGWSEPAWRPRGVGGYQLPENIRLHRQGQSQSGRKKKKRGPAWESADVADDAYQDGLIANEAVAQLNQLKEQGKPFFLAVGFLKPHLPFVAPKKYWDLYEDHEFGPPANYHPPKRAPKESLHTSGELRAYAGIPSKGPVSSETLKKLIHGYYACVSYTDAQVGRVLDALDELELADNTVVVLWGDHGWNLGDHGLWCKHSCYESSMHIPLIVRAPGVEGGQRVESLIETVDIYPTLCDLAGVKAPGHLEGDSFRPLLADRDAAWQNSAIGRFKNGDTLRTPQHRFTEYMQKGKRSSVMLYDHQADPGEDNNIAPDTAAMVERLTKQLRAGKGK